LLRYMLMIVTRIVCVVVLFAAILWSFRIALADHAFNNRHTLGGGRQAVRLMPNQALYSAELANQLHDTDPEQAKKLLEHSLQINPYASAQWIQLGLWYETENDPDKAEKALLRAASVDATFMPSWSLANYYFRHGNEQQFWIWARKTLQMVPKDASPIFRLSWLTLNDAPLIRNKLDIHSPEIQVQYLSYILGEGHIDAVGDTSLDLAGWNRKEDTNTLVGACNWLLDQNRPDAALAVWNALAKNHQIVFPAVSPTAGLSVTNADFNTYPTSLGFDWHFFKLPGVAAFLNGAPPGLRIEFSGEQPETALVLTQTIPVVPGAEYRFTAEYSTSDIAPETGLIWQVEDLVSQAQLATTKNLSSDTKSVVSVFFTALPETHFARLSLHYQRSSGTSRIRGQMLLRKVTVTAQSCTEKS